MVCLHPTSSVDEEKHGTERPNDSSRLLLLMSSEVQHRQPDQAWALTVIPWCPGTQCEGAEAWQACWGAAGPRRPCSCPLCNLGPGRGHPHGTHLPIDFALLQAGDAVPVQGALLIEFSERPGAGRRGGGKGLDIQCGAGLGEGGGAQAPSPLATC